MQKNDPRQTICLNSVIFSDLNSQHTLVTPFLKLFLLKIPLNAAKEEHFILKSAEDVALRLDPT